MTALTRDAILEADDRIVEQVEVPEWGGHVFVRSLSGAERDAYESGIASIRWSGTKPTVESNRANVRARLVAMATVDENGRNLFTDKDVLILGQKNAAALERVFTVAQRLSGLSDEDVEELKEQLGNAPSDGSGSSSPETSA
jgi:hypothetical protein